MFLVIWISDFVILVFTLPNVIIILFSVEGAENKKTACYDIEVEVDDNLKSQMNNFLLSTASQQEIQVKMLEVQYAMQAFL